MMSKEMYSKIKEELKRQKRSQGWLAREIGVTPQNIGETLRRLKKGENITVEKLSKIGGALNIKFGL